jgi:hypothetical protein
MRFGKWNFKSLYREGSLETVARELEKYNSDLVGVQKVRWDEGGGQHADGYIKNGNVNHHLGTGFFIHKGIILAVKRVEFINGSMSYITPGGRWC